MDDIGNLVYILIFVIWFLSRVFGKGRKKTTPNTAPGQPGSRPEFQGKRPSESTTPPVTFEDILRELTGTPIGPPEREPEVMEEEIPQDYRSEYYPEPEEETYFEVLEPERPVEQVSKPAVRIPSTGGDTLRFKEFKVKKQRSSKAARAAVKMLRSRHGARQAFLMKEIFDRKYF